MKQKCVFSISDIHDGWFDIDFKIEAEIAEISASDCYGNDSPKELLIMLTDFLLEKNNIGYVLFDEEPGTYFLSLEKEILTVAYSKYDCIDREIKGFDIPLRGTMTFNEISNFIPINEILLQTEIDRKAFIQSVYKAFYKYAQNHLLYDKYEENWYYFPQKEWDIFKQAVKQKGWHKAE